MRDIYEEAQMALDDNLDDNLRMPISLQNTT